MILNIKVVIDPIKLNLLALLCTVGLVVNESCAAFEVAPDEMAAKAQWLQQNLLDNKHVPPFSFNYNDKASSTLLPSYNRSKDDINLDANRTQHILTWIDAASTLQIRCVIVEYKDYPVVEWTVYFKNIGTNSTPILENIQGLDTSFSRADGPEFMLHGNQGDFSAPESYAPFEITLNPSSVTNFCPAGSGKSCDGPRGWPYYNLEMPGGGVTLAIGWPGQWASSFTRDSGTNLRIKAGQQLTHLILNPGEEIRTPLIALTFWRGSDLVRVQNLWRHWYMAHVIPRVHGKPPSPMFTVGDDNTNIVNDYFKAGIRPDILWRDADTKPYDWYPTANGPYKGNIAWFNTGTWEVDTNNYPHGFTELSDAVHELGMKFLLWFEPERVGNPNSWLATKHPEWLLPGIDGTGGRILNEGNPAAFNWLLNHIDSMIKTNGIDWYREDMNGGGPLPAWRKHDAFDRQGITENFYVQGHLAYWDALLARNPGLRIDSCASGGRRNDLESMRRAVPLWRSDFAEDAANAKPAEANQSFTYALSSWLPFQGTTCSPHWDPYSFRSAYVASFDCGGLNPANTESQRQAFTELKRIAGYMLESDYYPLTPYSLTNNVWVAWQFHQAAKGEGFAQAFRRGNCDDSSKTLWLSGLNPDKQYDVRNLDEQGSRITSGKDLIERGLTVNIDQEPGSAIIIYKRLN